MEQAKKTQKKNTPLSESPQHQADAATMTPPSSAPSNNHEGVQKTPTRPVGRPSKRKLQSGGTPGGADLSSDEKPLVTKRRRRSSSMSCTASPTSLFKPAMTERQQLALLLQMTDPQKCQTPPGPGVSSVESSPRDTPGKSKIHRRNERGETSLHLACIKGDLSTVMSLIEQGADVNAIDNAGWTPLHEACNYGHIKIVSVLVDKGAYVNAPGMGGETPLHDAVINDHVDVVRLLLTRGADPTLTNSTDKTPLAVCKNDIICSILRNASRNDAVIVDEEERDVFVDNLERKAELSPHPLLLTHTPPSSHVPTSKVLTPHVHIKGRGHRKVNSRGSFYSDISSSESEADYNDRTGSVLCPRVLPLSGVSSGEVHVPCLDNEAPVTPKGRQRVSTPPNSAPPTTILCHNGDNNNNVDRSINGCCHGYEAGGGTVDGEVENGEGEAIIMNKAERKGGSDLLDKEEEDKEGNGLDGDSQNGGAKEEGHGEVPSLSHSPIIHVLSPSSPTEQSSLADTAALLDDDGGVANENGGDNGDDDNGMCIDDNGAYTGDDGTDNDGADNGTNDNSGIGDNGADNNGTDDNGANNNGTDHNGTNDNGADNNGTDNDSTGDNGADNNGTVTNSETSDHKTSINGSIMSNNKNDNIGTDDNGDNGADKGDDADNTGPDDIGENSDTGANNNGDISTCEAAPPTIDDSNEIASLLVQFSLEVVKMPDTRTQASLVGGAEKEEEPMELNDTPPLDVINQQYKKEDEGSTTPLSSEASSTDSNKSECVAKEVGGARCSVSITSGNVRRVSSIIEDETTCSSFPSRDTPRLSLDTPTMEDSGDEDSCSTIVSFSTSLPLVFNCRSAPQSPKRNLSPNESVGEVKDDAAILGLRSKRLKMTPHPPPHPPSHSNKAKQETGEVVPSTDLALPPKRRVLREVYRSRVHVSPQYGFSYLPPHNYDTFLLSTRQYKSQSLPQPTSPQDIYPPLAPSLFKLFVEQEAERMNLLTTHLTQVDRLVLSFEQELLRAHQKASCTPPVNVCSILLERFLPLTRSKDESLAGQSGLGKSGGGLMSPTGSVKDERLLSGYIQDVWDKYHKQSVAMACRHKNEVETLWLVQVYQWRERAREATPNNSTSIDVPSTHVPVAHSGTFPTYFH